MLVLGFMIRILNGEVLGAEDMVLLDCWICILDNCMDGLLLGVVVNGWWLILDCLNVILLFA